MSVKKVEIIRGTVIGPGQFGNAGDVKELPIDVANSLIIAGAAKPADEGAEVKDAPKAKASTKK